MGIHPPLVYFQQSTIWNPATHNAIGSFAAHGLDALVLQADEFFPNEGPNSVIPLIKALSDKGILSIIQPKNRLNAEHARMAVEAGAITLGANTDEPPDLVAKIISIVKAHPTADGRKRAIVRDLYRHPDASNFWWPSMGMDYQLAFVNEGKIPDKSVREYADALPMGPSIVINAGHFDNPAMRPDALSTKTFEEGAKLLKYLEAKGHGDVKLSVLVNDMYEFNADPQAARKAFHRRRDQYRRTGIHDLFPESYGNILRAYGIDSGRWPQVVQSRTETGILFAARQALPLLNAAGEDISIFASENGAPVCRTVAGTYFHQLEKKGADTIIHLYPFEHECSTRGGIMTATQAYGGSAKHALFLYAPSPDPKRDAPIVLRSGFM
ncbi:TPA: hypothetical protein HA281_03850 [Candidatus Woesearchaeota archaeon]|nr:hypothetical protein [Candidatus Woesearchaeota archaeon]HII64430.1 hypothetical protein [Candidatus Woesearchaeota archaeon]